MSDLDIIDLGAQAMAFPSARGRKSKPLMLARKRTLTQEDAEQLMVCSDEIGSSTPPIQRLRETHHALARLLAQGVKGAEASAITGYSPSRISILKNDPAFQELLAFYKDNVQEKYLDVHERLAKLGVSFVDEIQERLDATPEDFSIGQLLAATEIFLDRSVAPVKGAGNWTQQNPAAASNNIQITFVTPPPAEGIPTAVRIDTDEERAMIELQAEEV